MGYGDNIMATGIAKGAKARGKRIAFGDGTNILWDHHSEAIFRGNLNIAPVGSERDHDLEWVPFYRGNRIYNVHNSAAQRWEWNYDWHPIPGELFFSPDELRYSETFGHDWILIEPNTLKFKRSAINKRWSFNRYLKVADNLLRAGYKVSQFNYGEGHAIPEVRQIHTPSFRHALAALRNARLYIGSEGGMHHGAAAVNVPGVVLFGGFIPPSVTGYVSHTNITGLDGDEVACGSLIPCGHCIAALSRIKVNQVMDAVMEQLRFQDEARRRV